MGRVVGGPGGKKDTVPNLHVSKICRLGTVPSGKRIFCSK